MVLVTLQVKYFITFSKDNLESSKTLKCNFSLQVKRNGYNNKFQLSQLSSVNAHRNETQRSVQI